MGWLADRVKRVPIVGIASLLRRVFTFLSGLAVSAFMLFWTRFATGIAKANSIPVHQSLIADNYPIGIRARMSAVMNIGDAGDRASRARSLVAAIATWAGGAEGWRWAWFIARHPGRDRRAARVLHEGAAARPVREGGRARRGHRGREPGADLDGGGVRRGSRRSRRSAPSIVGVLRARASGCSASSAASQSLYLNDTLHVHEHAATAGFILSLSGIAALPFLPFVGALLRPDVPQGPGQGARARRRC